MIEITSKAELANYNFPTFIDNKVIGLLDVYKSTSLCPYGTVKVITSSSEISLLKLSVIEFAEKIICSKTIWWHLCIPRNNSRCDDVYIEEYLLSNILLDKLSDNLIRTIYEEELYL